VFGYYLCMYMLGDFSTNSSGNPVWPRVTRFGEFSPIGWLLTLDSFVKMIEEATKNLAAFCTLKIILILIKMDWATCWAIFPQTHLVILCLPIRPFVEAFDELFHLCVCLLSFSASACRPQKKFCHSFRKGGIPQKIESVEESFKTSENCRSQDRILRSLVTTPAL
jgi:hypothetical protein